MSKYLIEDHGQIHEGFDDLDAALDRAKALAVETGRSFQIIEEIDGDHVHVKTVLAAVEIFDLIATEVYYGMNLRFTLQDEPEETRKALARVFLQARATRERIAATHNVPPQVTAHDPFTGT